MISRTWKLAEADKRSVLLLEDDDQFAATLTEFLQLHSCAVTWVKSGVEGLHQVMLREFDVILCDMVTPTFPGDKFYVAVQRVQPAICERFIFMTGHQADPKWDGFIRSVRGLTLWKPFPMHDLLSVVRTVVGKSREGEGPHGSHAISRPPVIAHKESIWHKVTAR